MSTEHNHIQLTCYHCILIMPLFLKYPFSETSAILLISNDIINKMVLVIVTAAVWKALRELFSDPQASAQCRLCRIRRHGSYLKLFCAVSVNLSRRSDPLGASFFVGVAFPSQHHRRTKGCRRQFVTHAFQVCVCVRVYLFENFVIWSIVHRILWLANITG